jgi:hypothetical protein
MRQDEWVDWMLNSGDRVLKRTCVDVFSENLDNCIGESGKKASHGCDVQPGIQFRLNGWMALKFY